jgi:hypothetical protein
MCADCCGGHVLLSMSLVKNPFDVKINNNKNHHIITTTTSLAKQPFFGHSLP